MKLSTSAIFAAILALTSAAPVSPADEGVLFKRASINDSGDSTFVNQSSGGSPKVADCRQLASNIAGGGTWIYIGNQDIIDLINDSIKRFQWNSLVGSKGVMKCQNAGIGGTETVSWGLYHN